MNRPLDSSVPARADTRWKSYVPLALVSLLGVIVTWDAFRAVTDWERQRVHNAFQATARDRVLMVHREIEDTLGVVQDVGSFFDASQWVKRREFRKFVGPALTRYGSIQALEWIPRVDSGERVAFEEAARISLATFRITEVDPAGNRVRAGRRPLHFPVLYVQPYPLNKDLLGLDLAADPATLDALLQVRDAGRMQVSERIPLEQEGITDFGFVARLPVYNKGDSDGDEGDVPVTQEERQRLLRGFAAGVFRIGAMVERALESLSPSGIDMVISDISGVDGKQFLYRHISRRRVADADSLNPVDEKMQNSREFIQTVDIVNRQWEIVCTSIPGYFQVDHLRGWIVLAGGWAFTALLTVYLSTLVGRNAKVKRLVTQRTLQLVEVNAALNSEISERIHAEKELQTLNDTLEQRVANRTAEAEQRADELEQFAYVTSHDLKAPLRGIANLVSWLQEDLKEKLTDASREQLTLVRDRVQRMNALIEGLLEYSRIGRTAHSMESVDVAKLLDEIIDSLSPPRGFTVEVAVGMPVLHTDRLQLSQVFSNLIGNGIKHHSSEQGCVRVTVSQQGKFYEFTVADDGPGIAPEYHDRVFTMFQVLEAKDYGNDTGIGLALVKKIVQEHGGSITLDSAAGKGARFRFTWPGRG
jgi:signal transduction histidine kinase